MGLISLLANLLRGAPGSTPEPFTIPVGVNIYNYYAFAVDLTELNRVISL